MEDTTTKIILPVIAERRKRKLKSKDLFIRETRRKYVKIESKKEKGKELVYFSIFTYILPDGSEHLVYIILLDKKRKEEEAAHNQAILKKYFEKVDEYVVG